MLRAYLYIALTLLLTVYGQLVIKWRVNLSVAVNHEISSPLQHVVVLLLDPYVLSGLFTAFIASCTWMLALSRMELSRAYPYMAMSFVLVPIASGLLLSEAVAGKTFLGAVLIIVGIAVSVS